MWLILRVLCTRKTTSLDAIVERLVDEANSDVHFTLDAAPSGYSLSATTVNMAASAFELMHGAHFGAFLIPPPVRRKVRKGVDPAGSRLP